MNELVRLVEGLTVYRDKITVAIDAVSALLGPASAEPAPLKRLPKATGNGKRKVKRVKVKAASNGKRPRLTEETRAAIRKALATEKVGAVAKRFGVSWPTVKKIAETLGSPSAPPQQQVDKPSAGPKLRCSYCGRAGVHPRQCDHCKKDRF